jgi:Glycosyltransferase Family 4
MRIQWIHNYSRRDMGMFMWDVHDRISSLDNCAVDDQLVPVIRTFEDLHKAWNVNLQQAHAYDIVHAQCGALVGLLAGRAKGKRRITSYRGSDIYWQFGGTGDQLLGILRCLLSWWAGLRSDAIVVMSHAMCQKVKHWPLLRKKPIHVIPDPAGMLYWRDELANIGSEILAKNWNVMIANQIHKSPIKRTQIIADAVKLCNNSGMHIILTALTGQTREAVRGTIQKSDTIAVASTHEGWPNIVKEALLLGKPFVATDISDLHRHAQIYNSNFIVSAHPLEFAMAWVEQIAVGLMRLENVDPCLVQFHPDVVAIKHKLLYSYYSGALN